MSQKKPSSSRVIAGPQPIVSRSPNDTRRLGRLLGAALRPGEGVLLTGDLGAGKSVLVRGIAEGMGADRWRGSPTFTLVNEYPTHPPLYHVDLYRLRGQEVADLGLEDYAGDEAVMAIEWPDRAWPYVEELLAGAVVRVQIEHLAEDERRITIAGEIGRFTFLEKEFR